ncbi:hypothetical protein ACFPES_03225 [Paenibacillus sp. GCM10023248]|nr:hypothetical protein [Paenibacillus sp. MAHUQ-63]MDD9266037.1 hypothetical protein [Paenibacillus sp. MAHUQ-63]
MDTTLVTSLAITGVIALLAYGYSTKKEMDKLDIDVEEDRTERNIW